MSPSGRVSEISRPNLPAAASARKRCLHQTGALWLAAAPPPHNAFARLCSSALAGGDRVHVAEHCPLRDTAGWIYRVRDSAIATSATSCAGTRVWERTRLGSRAATASTDLECNRHERVSPDRAG